MFFLVILFDSRLGGELRLERGVTEAEDGLADLLIVDCTIICKRPEVSDELV